jgi:hypothetical protein
MGNLFGGNTPARFWRCLADLTEAQWQAAVTVAAPVLQLDYPSDDVERLLEAVLGEGQFEPNHWTLSPAKRFYYVLKPVLPRSLTRKLRRLYAVPTQTDFPLGWPIEDRYVRFQWDVMRHLLGITGRSSLPFVHFWPEGHRSSLVLTHDVETAEGQAHVRRVADLEASLGFRSSFNFVPERYSLDHGLLKALREWGFEIGVHGLKHDGKLFSSQDTFARRARRINCYLKGFGAVGFRAPLTHRQPKWMQLLEIEYDLSFFDTDPFEPIPGGIMSVWPFEIGRFIELPYTLVQDYTLTTVLGEKTPRIWMQKVDFLEKYYGIVLVNTHPDYLVDSVTWNVYAEFLQAMRIREGYWHALPRDVAHWWRARSCAGSDADLPGAVQGKIQLGAEGIILELDP